MKRIFEFQCKHGHVTERYIDEHERHITCTECEGTAHRIVSMPRINLEGITGAFPGAADAWVRKREQKLKQEQKRAASHGE